jgi:hypothetical protein
VTPELAASVREALESGGLVNLTLVNRDNGAHIQRDLDLMITVRNFTEQFGQAAGSGKHDSSGLIRRDLLRRLRPR